MEPTKMMVMSSNVLVCPANRPKPQDVQFTVTEDQSKQKILKSSKLVPDYFCTFFFKMT